MRRRSALGAAVLLAAVLSALLACAADAREWTTAYPWQSAPATGFEGWTAYDVNPDTGQPGPWYRIELGGSSLGPGLALRPFGGRTYDNGDPTRETGGPSGRVAWYAPGGSRVLRATFDDMQLRNEDDDQYLRARIYGATAAQRATRDFGAAYGQADGITHELGPVVLAPPAGGTNVEGWLFTVCSGSGAPGGFTCPAIPAGTGSFGRFGSIALTLDDPDVPAIEVDADPAIGDGWVNKRRRQRLTVHASDPSSGMQRVRVQLRIGSSTRTLSDETIACDPTHRTAGLGGLVCPATATDPGRDSSTRDRVYVVTAWDYAGNQAVKTLTVRRDITRPSSASVSGELTRLTRAWTNRQGAVPVTLRGRDGQSGVARIELLARRPSGPTTVLAATEPPCARGCTSVSQALLATLDGATLPKDGRYRLSVRVTDRAGNQRSFSSGLPLKIDRRAPLGAGKAPFYTVLRDGRVRVYFQPGHDPSEGAGLGEFIVRYFARDASPGAPPIVRYASVSIASASVVRYRKARYRTLVLRDVDLGMPLEATRHGCDNARFGAPQAQFGGASQNCSQLVRLLRAGGTISIDELVRDQHLDRLQRYVEVTRGGRGLAPLLRGAFRNLARGLGRSSLLAVLGALVFADSTGCDAKPTPREFNVQAAVVFDAVRGALGATVAARPGSEGGARRQVAGARERLHGLRALTARYLHLYGDPCDVPGKLAHTAIKQVGPALDAADRHLLALRVEQIRADARSVALKIRRRAKTGNVGCRNADTLVNRFGGPGKGKENYVVYWSPPPPPDADVSYVGISRALKDRCRKHPADRRQGLQTLDLPHLSLLEARNVEEALIAHFGTRRERRNGGGTPIGQLRNVRHEISPRRADYCVRLLAGQSLLMLSGYARYAAAFFTRNERCVGVEGGV